MSLIRCTRLLNVKNGGALNFFKSSTVYYSDDKKPDDVGQSKDETKKESNKKGSKSANGATKQLSDESQKRLNELLKKLSSRSNALSIVKDVQTSKPNGYKKMREIQQLDGQDLKPKSIRDAAKAVSDELGDKKVKNEILTPYGENQNSTDFLEFVLFIFITFILQLRCKQFQNLIINSLFSLYCSNVISTMKVPAKRKDKQFKTPVTGSFTKLVIIRVVLEDFFKYKTNDSI